MGFELFKKEAAILENAKAFIESGAIRNRQAAAEFEALLGAYDKLFKSTRKLVRLSDRREAELNKLAKSLDDKNAMLQGLSEKLSKYLSPQIYQSIFSGEQEVQLETKRKKLTVFFSDLKDFTATTEDLQPEDLSYLLNKYLTEMSAIALDYGATIDKFIGDAMLLFFGDPETRGVKEDAAACVRMAMAMQNRMRELQHIWLDKGYERPFFMRIGINTGYCNVGNFGSAERMDYTIIGGEVNLAARLEGQAEPGGVLMSYETYALVKDFVEAEERSALRVKGIAREIRPFAITNIYDEGLTTRKFIRKERYGLNVLADLERLQGEDREVAIAELEDVIRGLKDGA